MTISRKGFTLLELLVVGIVISIVLATSFPLIWNLFFSDPLRKSTRLVAAFINDSRERALESENGTALLVDLSTGSLTALPQSFEGAAVNHGSPDPPGFEIAAPVSIVSVWSFRSGKTVGGTAPIYINRRGMVEPFLIDLELGARKMRVRGLPFDDSVEVLDQQSFSPMPTAPTAVLIR